MAKVVIDGKEYEDTAIASALAELSQLKEVHKPVAEFAGKFNMTVPELLQQSQGAFGALVRLQEEGLIDDRGMPKKAAGVENKGQPKAVPVQPAVQPLAVNADPNSVEAIVQRAMQPIVGKLDTLEQRYGSVEKAQSLLYRDRIMDRVKAEYPHLGEKQVHRLIAEANATQRSFWELAEEENKAEAEKLNLAVTDFAKQHGIDMEKMNKLKEMKADESKVGAVITEGKTLSSKKGEGTISPREATEQYFNTINEIERI